MNNDLISRSALKKALEVTQYNDIDDLTRTDRLIDNAPTVSFMISPDYVTELQNLNKELIRQLEEAERPKGEWHGNNFDEHSCPLCGHAALYQEEPDGYYEVQSNFCPFCGADMRGGRE